MADDAAHKQREAAALEATLRRLRDEVAAAQRAVEEKRTNAEATLRWVEVLRCFSFCSFVFTTVL